ncbi:MAG: DUF952 domain-containing protein [Steroidobacteraceae bacterium]
MRIVLHIAHRDMWEASAPGGHYRPLSLDSAGFIHCSTVEQTLETANQFFTAQEGLVLLCIDTSKVEPEVRYEAPACSGDQRAALFPHIYGPLNVSAVVQVVEFPPRADGMFELPPEISRLT